MSEYSIKRLYIYNKSEVPVFLEGLELLILPDSYIDVYTLYSEEEIENSQSLKLALENDLLEIIPASDIENYSLSMGTSSLDWTQRYFSILSVGASSYEELEPIQLATKIGKRTSQYYVTLKDTGGGRV
jgi:hypothetical protein